jgi:hypothetical protein
MERECGDGDSSALSRPVTENEDSRRPCGGTGGCHEIGVVRVRV